MKANFENLEKENKTLKDKNDTLIKDLEEQKAKNAEMFEENHQLHDRILVLNQQMADEFGMGAKQ